MAHPEHVPQDWCEGDFQLHHLAFPWPLWLALPVWSAWASLRLQEVQLARRLVLPPALLPPQLLPLLQLLFLKLVPRSFHGERGACSRNCPAVKWHQLTPLDMPGPVRRS